MHFHCSCCRNASQNAPRSQAHSRTRADHMQETAEDYVEAIYELIESTGQCRIVHLAKHFGVTHVTAIKIVRRLVGEGLVSTEPYQPVTLTRKGRTQRKNASNGTTWSNNSWPSLASIRPPPRSMRRASSTTSVRKRCAACERTSILEST